MSDSSKTWAQCDWRERLILIAIAPFVALIGAGLCIGLAAVCLIPVAAIALLVSLSWRLLS